MTFSNEMFDVLWEDSVCGLCVVSPEFRFVKANPMYCRMVGYSEEELRELIFEQITIPYDIDLDVLLATKVRNREIDCYEIIKTYYSKDRRIVTVHLVVNAVYDEEDKLKYFLVQAYPQNLPMQGHLFKIDKYIENKIEEPKKSWIKLLF